ncbi:amidase [Helcobacillus massiliensis]|uniref:amidase n=1 Tax=Helcobacillus massiliensis TaxID=521392 RepID=UPI0021A95FCA|nr:amidase [Helcobacillus massiliensis]MCT1557118.1 amidase [Helcobacillus massiliensis]MCT2036147.1 amidase [Helcobacillus massiliensis]MCT2331278.1 amidase [Helcobacillus massiliensis]
MSHLHELSAAALLSALKNREVSAVDAARHFLQRCEGDQTNAIVSLEPERALERAAQVDAGNFTGPLAGLPTADKDLHQRRGWVATFGTRRFRGLRAERTDALTTQLDSTGALSLGATASPEFGFTNYTRSLLHGTTTVPGRPDLNAGGSSGGAAAAVASRILPVAPGSDAGGSVRIPAAACGIIGLKPSRGRIAAMDGQDALGGLPTAGVLARSAEDAGILLDALITRGADGAPTSGAATAPPPPQRRSFADIRDLAPGLRVGVIAGPTLWDEVVDCPTSAEAAQAQDAAIAALTGLGAEVEEVRLPSLPGYAQAFMTLWMANAAQLRSLPSPMEEPPPFEALTRWLIEQGRSLDPGDVAASVGRFAEVERALICTFAPYDLVLSPTTALPPRPNDWPGDLETGDGLANFHAQCQYSPHTSMINVAGLPAVSVPTVRVGDGVSMSVQLIGRPGREDLCLDAAQALSAATGNIALSAGDGS